MAKKPSAGQLYYRIGLEARETENPDSPADYGNTQDAWVEQFERRAGYYDIRGGEEVMAARLQGKHIQNITVTQDTQTRLVTSDWRAVDKRNGEIFNIRDIAETTDRHWFIFVCERGVAT